MTDKIQPVYPKSSTTLNFKVDGIFGFPQQWRTTDEANPGMFNYIVRFSNIQVTNGKIYPRQLTQKQLREQQESKKKGAKKQAKKQQNPAQLEKLKQLQEKQQAEQKKREQLWSKMTEQQRIYHTCEDKHKSALLKFQPNNTVQKQLTDKLFVIFQQHILKDGGEWVYIYKVPTANEQELAKLKKSKPKNLNLNDLNPVSMRTWVDLNALKSTQNKQTMIRCKLHQVDATQQTPKPNLQKTYIKLSITLNQPLLTKNDQYSAASIIKDPPKPKPIPIQIKCVEQMKQQLRLAIQSLAMQYSSMFWKDLNLSQQQKSSQIFVNNRKNQHIKRKQQFLYDFNVSGKYKVLKQRLKKVIVYLCENKFQNKMQGAKSFTGITCSVRDQFYSQIYNFLVTSYSDTMSQLIQQKKQILKEVFVLNQQNQNKLTQQHLQSYKKQNKQQRFSRIVREYNIIGNYQYGKKMYKSAIAKQPENINLKYQYCLFCIKNGLNIVSQVLNWGYVQQFMEYNKQNKEAKLEFILFMIGSEENKSLKKAWILIRELINDEPNNVELLLYATILTEILGKNQCSGYFLNKAQRQELRKDGKLGEEGKHQQSPIPSELPTLTSIAKYNLELTPEERDNLWLPIVQKFSQLGLFNIIEKIKVKILNQENPLLKLQNIKILFFQQDFKQCKEKALELYNSSKNYQVLEIVIKCLHKLQQVEEKQKYLKLALKVAPKEKKSQVLLNLGFLYQQAGKYGNSKACLTKYLDGNEQSGGLSWQILGISQLKCGNFEEAIQCFRHSNLCDPYNKQVWIWIAEAYSKLKNFIMVNQCLNSYMDSLVENDAQKKKIKDLKASIQQAQAQNFYETSIKTRLLQRLEAY